MTDQLKNAIAYISAMTERAERYVNATNYSIGSLGDLRQALEDDDTQDMRLIVEHDGAIQLQVHRPALIWDGGAKMEYFEYPVPDTVFKMLDEEFQSELSMLQEKQRVEVEKAQRQVKRRQKKNDRDEYERLKQKLGEA